MPRLSRISGEEAIRVFQELGFSIARQNGSHVVLRKGDVGCVSPLHKEPAVGTLRSAIKQAKLSAEDFLEAYNQR
jgi:predicted RNA binding protein YcfA (HicA-like mRNA interferase family)